MTEDTVGVINPYALAEVVLGQKVDWKKKANPQDFVAKTLGVNKDELFDSRHESPIFAGAESKNRALVSKPFTKLLDPENTPAKNLAELKKGAVPKISKEWAMSLRDDAAQRLVSIFAPTKGVGSSSPQPWNPTGSEWVDPGDFFKEATEYSDPIQGALGDCYLIAALCAVAWARPHLVAHVPLPTGAGQQQFRDYINFHSGGTKKVAVGETVPLTTSGHHYIYARSKEPGEIWPCIHEKAYVKWKTNATNDRPYYPAIAGGSVAGAIKELTGEATKSLNHVATSSNDLWNEIRVRAPVGSAVFPMAAATYASADECPFPEVKYDSTSGICAWHAYSILGWIVENGKKYVVLRNPWGYHEGKVGSPSATSWSTLVAMRYPASIPLKQDGVFAIKLENYMHYYRSTHMVK